MEVAEHPHSDDISPLGIHRALFVASERAKDALSGNLNLITGVFAILLEDLTHMDASWQSPDQASTSHSAVHDEVF